MSRAFSEEFIDVDGSKVQLLKGGHGEPLLILHGTAGNSGWLTYARALAERFTVYLPSHPGFGLSDRPEWIESISDLACFYTWFLEKESLEGTRAIGFSMGGWLVAEMAVMCRHAFSQLILVDAVGVKPSLGGIADIFIVTPAQVAELAFYDSKQASEYDQLYGQPLSPEQQVIAERNREMAARLCWKPYMYDPRLPSLLKRIGVPTRIIWGRQDQMVPLECGEIYHQAIPRSELAIIDECGHSPQIEKPDEFIKQALDFFDVQRI